MLSGRGRLISAGYLLLAFSQAGGAAAEVLSSNSNGFSVKHSLEISATPQQVYDSIVKSVGSWWNSSHTFSGSSKNLSIDDQPGGCFCERWDGKAGVRHMTVVFANPGKILRMSGGLGPFQDMGVAGSLTFALAWAEGRTLLTLTYNAGGYSTEGLAKWAGAADSMLLEQVSRLKRFVETGNAEND